jgi:hypothetical protein
MLGLSPLPAGAIVFPLLWFLKTATGWPKYSYDNQRVGVSRFRSYFRNLALYYLYAPNISRNTIHINDEAKGPFVSTAGSGGRTFFPWATRRLVFYFGGLSGVTTAIGLYRMATFGLLSLGYFGFVMNVIWPAVMLASVCYALKLVWNEIRERNNVPGLTGALWSAARHRDLRPLRNWGRLMNNEFLSPLTINWYQEMRAALREARNHYGS